MRGSTTGSVVYFAHFDQRKDSIALNELGKLSERSMQDIQIQSINKNSPKQVIRFDTQIQSQSR
jgi:hypothetical protein